MSDSSKIVVKKSRRLRARLRNVESLRRVLACFLAATGVLTLVVLADRLLPIPWIDTAKNADLPMVAGVLYGIALLAGLGWAFLRRPTLNEAATAADERLRLRERLSSALYAMQREDRMSQAVVEDAASRIQTVRASDVFPYPFYKELRWLIGAAAVAAALIVFLPPLKLAAASGLLKDTTQAKLPEEESKKAAEGLKEIKDELAARTKLQDPLQLDQLERDLEELQKDFEAKNLNEPEAIAKLSKLEEKTKSRREEAESKLAAGENLDQPTNSKFTNELSKDLKNGNFEKAAEKMEELKEKVESGEMTEQDQKQLAEELKNMANQLSENPDMAKSMADAAQALQNGDLKEAAQSMAQSQSAAQEMQETMEQMESLDQLQNSLSEAKEGMLNGTGFTQAPGRSGQRGEGRGGDQSGQNGQFGQNGQRGQGERGQGERGQGGRGRGEHKTGEGQEQSDGMGGPGQGRGNIAQVGKDKVTFTPERAPMDVQPGQILQSLKVDGEAVKGEALVKFRESIMQYSQAAEDSLEREPLPLEYKTMVSDYFDSIKGDVQATTPAAPVDSAPK